MIIQNLNLRVFLRMILTSLIIAPVIAVLALAQAVVVVKLKLSLLSAYAILGCLGVFVIFGVQWVYKHLSSRIFREGSV